MKKFLVGSLFGFMVLCAVLANISCSNTPTSANNFQSPVQTIVALNPSNTATFTSTFTFTPTITPTPTVITGLSSPLAIAVDHSGNLFIGDTGNNQIDEYTNGVLNLNWGAGGKAKGKLAFTSPQALATDGSGNVYVIGITNTISVFNNIGIPKAQITYSGLSISLGGIAVNSAASTIYVSDKTAYKIWAIPVSNPSGTTAFVAFTPIPTPGSTPTTYPVPYGLAVDSSGKVYVAVSDGTGSTAGNTVQIYNTNGSSFAVIQGFNGTYGVAVDTASPPNIFVSDTNNHQIEEFASGTYSVPTAFFGNGAMASPRGIAINTNANPNVISAADSGLSEVFNFVE